MELVYSGNHLNDSPKGLVYLLFIVGLLAMSYTLITKQLSLFTAVMLFPSLILLLIYSIQRPIISYLLYIGIVCYFTAIYRYSQIENLSIIIDCTLALCIVAITFNVITNHEQYPWQNGFNLLTAMNVTWACYCILILMVPDTFICNFEGNRGVFFSIPLTCFITGVLLCTVHRLRSLLFWVGLYTITAFLKAYWQKKRGFDAAESAWLVAGGAWHTHALSSGMRYFSFFTDAGNFGACMGLLSTVFSIIGLVAKRNRYRLFLLLVACLASISMAMSGTRGAVVIPFGGMLLFFLLSKNFKIMAVTAIAGILGFSFFYFTDIGNDNPSIRRMRTAFRPEEDASYNVRAMNRERFAYYLADKPFGVGLGGKIVDTHRLMELEEDFIPTDSFYVEIWAEGGIVGLLLYLLMQVAIFIRCGYLILFKVKNKQLRYILSALTAGCFGLCLNAYVGRAINFQPGNTLFILFLSITLNGERIDKQLKPNEIII